MPSAIQQAVTAFSNVFVQGYINAFGSACMAMAAIGLNTNIVKLVKNGGKPILMGLICWFALAITSLIVQYTILTL